MCCQEYAMSHSWQHSATVQPLKEQTLGAPLKKR